MNEHSILVVEDERIVAEDIRSTLESYGYKVVGIASRGEVAIEYARELHPDLILMDINLAGTMNGIEAADTIRTNYQIPVIFLTAYSDKRFIEMAKCVEPYGYILKPFDERELYSLIEIAFYKHDLDRKLKESEERYRSFLQDFLGIAFRINPDLTPAFYHGAVEAITGYSELQLLSGMPSLDQIFQPDDRAIVQTEISRIRTKPGSSTSFEFRIARRDGRIRWIQALVRSSFDSPPVIQGSYYDITERKEAEYLTKSINRELEEKVLKRTRFLKDQLMFLEQLMDTIPNPVFYKDSKGYYLGCNHAFETYCGLEKGEIVGKTDADLFPPDFSRISAEKDDALLKNPGIQVYESRLRHADRSERDVILKRATFSDSQGDIGGFIGVILDFTELKRAEETVEAQKQFCRELIRDQKDLIIRYNPDWTILFANDAFLSYFSRTPENTIGFIFRLPFCPDDLEKVTKYLRSLNPDHSFASTTSRIMTPDGTIRYLSMVTRAYFNERGQISEFQSTFRDITSTRENPGTEKHSG